MADAIGLPHRSCRDLYQDRPIRRREDPTRPGRETPRTPHEPTNQSQTAQCPGHVRQLEWINFTFDPAGRRGRLEALGEAEKLATAALAVPNGPEIFNANKEFEIAQVHELRGRVYEFQSEPGDKAGREYDLAASRYDKAIRLLESLGTKPDHDFMLQVRRCQAGLRLRMGKDLPAVRKEANNLLEVFVRKRGNTAVDRGDFLRLLVEVEQKSGNLDADGLSRRSPPQALGRAASPPTSST